MPRAITGAGSTWVYPLVAKWAAAYQKETSIQVNYQSIGSGGGIKQIEGGVVAFGASDMPLTPDDLAKHNLIQFPTAIAEDPVYNLPGIKPGEIVLSGPSWRKSLWATSKNGMIPPITKLNPEPEIARHCHHRRASFRWIRHDFHVRGLPLQSQPRVEDQARRAT